jgi:molecular chaperone GrpE
MSAENDRPEANGETPPDEAAAPTSNREKKAEADPPPASSPALDPLAEAKAETKRFKEQWMRSAADFDNFRKRTRKELEDQRKAGKEEILKDFLPVFDNLERAIMSAQRANVPEVKPVIDGLQLILRQFLDTLGRAGITKVPTVGSQFDPSHHEAIQQVETDEHPPGTVVAEVQPGYLQGDRLIRAAMVVVAKPKADGAGGEGGAA